MSESAARLRSDAFPQFSLRDLVTALFYYKRAVLLAFLVPVLLGLAAGMVAHTSFVAQARLLVLYGSDYVFHPGPRDTGSDITLDRNQIMAGELQILGSPALLTEVVRAVTPQAIYPGLADDDTGVHAAVTRLAVDLNITTVPQSNVIELSLRNPSRDVAIRVLNELISHYLTFRAGIFGKTEVPGVSVQRQQFADRLKKAEEDLAQFSVEHGITNLDDQIASALSQKTANTNDLNNTVQAIGDTKARAASLHAQLASLSPTMQMFAESGRTQQSATLQDSLAKLEVQRRDLLARYQDDFPLVHDIDRQIAGVKSQLAGDPSRESAVTRMGRNPIYDDLHKEEIADNAQLLGLQAKQAELVAEGERLQARSAELTDLSRHYRDLQRTRDVLDQSYRAIARSSEETQLSDALERAQGANVRLVQPADAPLAGRNQRVVLWAAGVVLGLLCVVAVFTLLNATRQVFISVRDVERQLDLPVLLAVPVATPPRRRAAAPKPGRARTVERPSFGL